MSGHADRHPPLAGVLRRLAESGDDGRTRPYAAALDEVVTEQADRIAWLEGDVAGWRIKLAECEERHR